MNDELFFANTISSGNLSPHTPARSVRVSHAVCVFVFDHVRTRTRYRARHSSYLCEHMRVYCNRYYTQCTSAHTQQTFHAQSMRAANHTQTYTHTLTHLFAKEELRGNHILKAATMTTSTISRPECLCICLYANV